METNLIKELLVILSENEDLFNKKECWGLCGLASSLFGVKEHGLICDYIKKECAGNCEEFWYEDAQVEPFYFPRGEWEPRRIWLDEQIKKLS